MFEPQTEALCSLADWCSIWHEELSPRLLGGQSRLVFPKVRLFYFCQVMADAGEVMWLTFYSKMLFLHQQKNALSNCTDFMKIVIVFMEMVQTLHLFLGSWPLNCKSESVCALFVQILLCVWTLLFIFSFFYGILGKQGASLRWSKVLIKTRGHRTRRID